MLTHRVPRPPDRGDRICCYHLLRHLHEHRDVDLACTCHEAVTTDQRTHLAALADRLFIQPIALTGSMLRGAIAWGRGRAISPAWHRHPPLARILAAWHANGPFDVVLTCCTTMAGYADVLTPRTRQILDLVDIDSLKMGWLCRKKLATTPMDLPPRSPATPRLGS